MSKDDKPGRFRDSILPRVVGKALLVAESLVALAAVAVIIGCLAIFWVLAFESERGADWTGSLRPVQYYEQIDPELLADYLELFAVAHNSGDSVGATLEALSYGADVIEVDVISLNGRLYAAHGTPPTWVGTDFFTGPPLERIWIASALASAIKLDLKESSPAFRELLLDFLSNRPGSRRVIIVSNDPDLLHFFAEQKPEVLLLFSIGTDRQFHLMEGDPALAAVVDGVSIRHSLLDEERAEWLEQRSILTFAWTVNDIERVNELVLLGVDAITTDNLAIMKLLGGEGRSARQLDKLRPELAFSVWPPSIGVDNEV